jgi:hypothetical protein
VPPVDTGAPAIFTTRSTLAPPFAAPALADGEFLHSADISGVTTTVEAATPTRALYLRHRVLLI